MPKNTDVRLAEAVWDGCSIYLLPIYGLRVYDSRERRGKSMPVSRGVTSRGVTQYRR